MTAATAPATAPRTVVAAVASVDGFFGTVFRLVRDAAARAAVFRFALFVFGVGRFRGARDFCVERFRAARFATDFLPRDRPPAERFADFRAGDDLLPDLRLATFPPIFSSFDVAEDDSELVEESLVGERTKKTSGVDAARDRS